MLLFLGFSAVNSFYTLNENTMAVAIRDKGFGELFPATDAVVRQEVTI